MKDLKQDFQDFTSQGERPLSSSVLGKIKTEIEKARPSKAQVFTKLGALHLASSVLTLMACPQFGLRLFFKGMGLMHYFMKINTEFCFVFCGFLYLATTFLLVNLFLKYDEWLIIKKSRALIISSVALISLGAFIMASPEVSFYSAILWLFGASLGAELMSLRKWNLSILRRA